MTFQEAVALARDTKTNGSIMRDPETGKYHYVTAFQDHWKKRYEEVAAVTVRVEVVDRDGRTW